MSAASSNAWLLVNPDNSYEIVPVSPSSSVAANAVSKVQREGGPFMVCNHFVIEGVWMWYRYYNMGINPSTCDTVNHCALSLWSFRDPAWEKRPVYGPVVFAGSISGNPLTADNLARLVLIARLAQTEAERISREELLA